MVETTKPACVVIVNGADTFKFRIWFEKTKFEFNFSALGPKNECAASSPSIENLQQASVSNGTVETSEVPEHEGRIESINACTFNCLTISKNLYFVRIV